MTFDEALAALLVGSPGYRGWKNLGLGYANVAYARDGLGMVHLQGSMFNPGPGNNPTFILPPGYRPAATRQFAVAYGMNTNCACTPDDSLSTVKVLADGEVVFDEFQANSGGSGTEGVSLDGVEFRAK